MKTNKVPVRFIVKRDSSDEMTMAIITANAHHAISKQFAFLDAVKRAVTFWINHSPKGKELWVYSVEDLNIGDLSSYLGDKQLILALNAEGIFNFDVSIVSEGECSSTWNYDTVLVHPENILVEQTIGK